MTVGQRVGRRRSSERPNRELLTIVNVLAANIWIDDLELTGAVYMETNRIRILDLLGVRRSLLLLLFVIAVGLAYGAWTYLNDRGRLTTVPVFTELSGRFSNGVFYSHADPTAQISFAPEYTYIGGQKFILYGTTDVEQHFFIKADETGMIQSAFLLQFESVRPGIDWQYDYSNSPLRSQIGGLDFFTDVAPRSQHLIFKQGRTGSDFNLAQKFLSQKGYQYPKNYVWARMVHLPTEDKRKEMLIIFTDDLAPSGLTRRALEAGGVHEDQWAKISHQHLDKMQRAISIRCP